MSSTDHPIHHGTFAEGEAHPETYVGEDRVGTFADGGHTLDALADEHGFIAGSLDFLFLDHDKDAYVADLQSILERGWLHTGSIAVADNVAVPGAPKYREYMRQQQGKLWNTVEHKTHAEYQSLVSDLVLESEYLG